MQILFVTAHLPSPRVRQAGQKSTYFACQWFARRHSVHLLCFATESELDCFRPEDMNLFRSFDVVPVTTKSRLLGLLSKPQLPVYAAVRHSALFRKKLQHLLEQQAFDVAYLDFTAMMQYHSILRSVPLMGVLEVDVSFRIWERRAAHSKNFVEKKLFELEALRTKRWELDHLNRMDFVLVYNPEERILLQGLLPAAAIRDFHIWIQLGEGKRVPAYGSREPNSLVFCGAMDRGENIDAATYAADQIMPRVWARRPQCRYYVAGGNLSTRLAQRYENSRVIFPGFIENIFAFLASKQVALLPMRLGAGIKVKVLECMAAGLPVVTTPAGAEGIPGQDGVHFLVGRSEQELADSILALLESPQRAAEMGLQARATVLSSYSFQNSVGELEDYLLRKLESARRVVGNSPAPRIDRLGLEESAETGVPNKPD
jgi:polysaccharide biosynthesis protein PslH